MTRIKVVFEVPAGSIQRFNSALVTVQAILEGTSNPEGYVELECPFCKNCFEEERAPYVTRSILCPGCGKQSVWLNEACLNDEWCPEEYGCGVAGPMGFVPEAGCPIHDPDPEPHDQ